MQAIITQPRPDGTFPDVGMTGRFILERPTMERLIGAAKRWSPCRVEIYGPRQYAEPIKVIFV